MVKGVNVNMEIKINTKYLLEEKERLSEEIAKLLEKYSGISKNIDDLNQLKSRLEKLPKSKKRIKDIN